MKRPAAIGGRALPRETGRCALCGAPLGDPRDGSMKLVYPAGGAKARFALVCRDEEQCRQRRTGGGTGLPGEDLG